MNEIKQVQIPYGDGTLDVRLPARNLLAVLSPRDTPVCDDPAEEIQRAIESPISTPRLREAARGAKRVVICADDLTRQTPVQTIIPLLLDELHAAGLRDEQVTVLIALGTHRYMTQAEIVQRFGAEVTRRVQVLNNPWQDPAALVDLGITPNGTPVSVSRIALEADFLLGLGSIVPHHIPGYSAGAKIIQPGVCGAATTGATHYLSTRAPRSYLGQVENPVRAELELIAGQVGLKAILNTVLDHSGRLVQAFYGHTVQAHRAGVRCAQQVYGVPTPGAADIVVAGSHPCDIEFWQAHKSLYSAEMVVRHGGSIIIVTPSPEGVTVTHRELLQFAALPSERIDHMIRHAEVKDIVSAAVALAWAKSREHAPVSLVSDGIPREDALALGFTPYASVDDALQAAFQRLGPEASVNVLTHAPEILPILAG
ncbi:MAG TPA: nickel-dependent lactate racemase [Anaerolineae bacterium]